ncbi:hypothetical protein BDP27DRAFT_1342263 [Rhodocollybia butyracea]|uniref:Calcineurin-like phosphoesterase domain-containing protein n=1 Tax=Rhodocollybia butyracea TaxID=206335 RepID=A0A9P5PA54_9AGAR|nr:hypothetical protein BDP27DRAFT_1342263 [Rhodocollybia butyracea]
MVSRELVCTACVVSGSFSFSRAIQVFDIDQDDSYQRLREFSTKVNANPSLGSFFLLDRTRHDISPTLTILGCSLWSALNQDDLDILSGSHDFRRIDEFNPTTVSSMAQHEPERQIEGTGPPHYADDRPTLQNCWASGHVKLWAFGHTHWCLRVYSNQRGYGEGQALYDAGKVVEI